MRCPSRKDWVLFYYNDTASPKEALSLHLKECAHCRKEYASLIFSLESIIKDRITLPKPDLDAMIARAQMQNRRAGIASLKEKIADVLSQIRLRLLYQPQIAFVALLVMVGLVVIPLSISSPMRLAEADIAEVEVELALEDTNNFDILSDVLIPDDFSKNFSVTAISRIG